MLSRIRVLIAFGVVLSMPPGVALAHFIGPGAHAPPPTTAYQGKDSAGRVTFKVYQLYSTSGPLYVFGFRFANKCSAKPTIVNANMPVGRTRYRFHYQARGVTVSGSLNAKTVVSGGETSIQFGLASGTARVRTSRCDSSTLKFTAKMT
jgi:hypothetical protein